MSRFAAPRVCSVHGYYNRSKLSDEKRLVIEWLKSTFEPTHNLAGICCRRINIKKYIEMI